MFSTRFWDRFSTRCLDIFFSALLFCLIAVLLWKIGAMYGYKDTLINMFLLTGGIGLFIGLRILIKKSPFIGKKICIIGEIVGLMRDRLARFAKRAAPIVVGICVLVIVMMVGIALFGGYFKADEAVLKDTAKGQAGITRALFFTFGDSGRLDVRSDYSVYAYIPKKNFMLVPFPDRDGAITIVGTAWCKDGRVVDSWYRLPKVELRDIQTGEVLGSYRCLQYRW